MSGQDTGLRQNGRHRGRIWLAVGVLVVVVAMGWWWVHAQSDARAELSDGRAGETGAALARSSIDADSDLDSSVDARRASREGDKKFASPQRDSEFRMPIADGMMPTAEAAKILLPLAQAGRADAMRELANRLIQCRDFVTGDEASIRRNALRQFYDRNGHVPKNDVELSAIAAAINAKSEMVELCRGLDPALMSTRIDWMERAAQGGDLFALLGYGGNALNDMRNFDDAVTNLDEVVRRRQLARDFLQTALNRGACTALMTFSTAYSGLRNPYGWLFKPDPYLSLVYAEAVVRAGVYADVLPNTLSGVADPERRAAAAAQGAALAARHCNQSG